MSERAKPERKFITKTVVDAAQPYPTKDHLVWDDDQGPYSGSAYVFAPADSDSDGVPDELDVCADTVIHEGVPTKRLGRNRFALVDDDGVFDTNRPQGGGPKLSFNIEETGGCSCEQIIEALGLGKGHVKFGCSIGAMEAWVDLVNP
jgi:hypothetical protein